jgi:dephospho-CoA kinase
VEIPLLYEVGWEAFYDGVIVVLSDESIAKRRFQKAGFQTSDYDLRMKRHQKPEQKAARADYIIHNNGSLEDLRQEVIKLNNLIHKLTSRGAH